MAGNDWLRLWHDMPNDPKWRTIARVSGQPIALVIALYVHLLVDASRNVTRGHVDVTHEDLASALDVTEDAVRSIMDAMQGRVMEGNDLSGWARRQPKREDQGNPETGAKSASQRKREQREREKEAAQIRDNPPDESASRDVTKCHAREDKDSKPPTSFANAQDVPPQAAAKPKRPTTTFVAWLENVRASNEKVLSDYRPVWDYAEKVGLPADWIELAWLRFRQRYSRDEKAKRKRYADWRQVFLNAVEGNWLGLWYWVEREQAFRLTTVGVQADAEMREAA